MIRRVLLEYNRLIDSSCPWSRYATSLCRGTTATRTAEHLILCLGYYFSSKNSQLLKPGRPPLSHFKSYLSLKKQVLLGRVHTFRNPLTVMHVNGAFYTFTHSGDCLCGIINALRIISSTNLHYWIGKIIRGS